MTQCNKCSSSIPLPTNPVQSPSGPAIVSTPYVPTAVSPQQTPASGSGSGYPGASATPSQTPYNAAGRNVVGAGAGLAAVFGVAALLL